MNTLQAAREELAHYDNQRDFHDRRNRIHYLTRIGMTELEIAQTVGISDRGVSRHKLQPPAPQRPRLYNPDMASEKRVRELGYTADFALQLAAVLRDEDPSLVWGSLTRLSRRQLQEIAVIALAAIPVDRTKEELLSWVRDLVQGEA